MGGSSIFARIASFSAFNFVTNSLPFMHASAGRHRIAPDGNRLAWERNSAGSHSAALRGIGLAATRAPTEFRRERPGLQRAAFAALLISAIDNGLGAFCDLEIGRHGKERSVRFVSRDACKLE